MRTAKQRQLMNAGIFLGPAILLLIVFFLLPIVVDLVIAFSDMERMITFNGFSTEQFAKIAKPSEEAWFGYKLRGIFSRAIGLTAIYVFFTLAFFNVGLALVLALITTSLPDRLGGFFRAVWLLPRMSPSVVYAMLWIWVVDPTENGLLNQVAVYGLGLEPLNLRLDHPMMLVVLANGFIGASLGMIILTSAIRAIPEHLFHAARSDGAGALSIVRHIILPALRWPLSYITVYQALALLVSFEYIFLLMGASRKTMTLATLAYTKSLAPGIGAGQYAYGAAISLILIVIGIVVALIMWRLTNMKSLLSQPKIETH